MHWYNLQVACAFYLGIQTCNACGCIWFATRWGFDLPQGVVELNDIFFTRFSQEGLFIFASLSSSFSSTLLGLATIKQCLTCSKRCALIFCGRSSQLSASFSVLFLYSIFKFLLNALPGWLFASWTTLRLWTSTSYVSSSFLLILGAYAAAT